MHVEVKERVPHNISPRGTGIDMHDIMPDYVIISSRSTPVETTVTLCKVSHGVAGSYPVSALAGLVFPFPIRQLAKGTAKNRACFMMCEGEGREGGGT